MAVLKGDALLSWVTETCVAQGLPVKVEDARVVTQVRDLLNGGTAAPARGASPEEATGRRSKAPVRYDPSGVQLPGPQGTSFDHDMIEDRVDDRPLTQEGEARPLAS